MDPENQLTLQLTIEEAERLLAVIRVAEQCISSVYTDFGAVDFTPYPQKLGWVTDLRLAIHSNILSFHTRKNPTNDPIRKISG